MKSLSEVKKSLKVGDKVNITNKLKSGKKEEREVVTVQKNGIVTMPPKIDDRGVKLNWQRSRNTRIIGNKVQFLLAEEENGKYMAEHPEAYGIDTDWWLELELINK